MGRKQITEEEKARKALFKEFLKEYPIKDGQDLNILLVREFVSDIIGDGLEAELDEELGYSRYDNKNKQTVNQYPGERTVCNHIPIADIFLYSTLLPCPL